MSEQQRYFVAKYFDDHFNYIVQEGLSKENAETLRDALIPGEYISYEVRPMCDKIYS